MERLAYFGIGRRGRRTKVSRTGQLAPAPRRFKHEAFDLSRVPAASIGGTRGKVWSTYLNLKISFSPAASSMLAPDQKRKDQEAK